MLTEKAAKLYYIDQLSQPKIASLLRISQSQVSRLLKRAREEEIVRIQVRPSHLLELEEQLLATFGLTKVRIVPTPSLGDLNATLGHEAAALFEEIVRDEWRIGISGGRALSHFVQRLRYQPRQLRVYPLVLWGTADPFVQTLNPTALADLMRHKFGPHVTVLRYELPVTALDEKSRRLVEENIKRTFDALRQAEMIITGAGNIGPGNPTYLMAKSLGIGLRAFKEKGVVGSIFGHTINAEGAFVKCEELAHLVTPLLNLRDMADLASKAERHRVVLVSGGKERVAVIAAALKARLCNVLVIDSDTGQALVRSG